MTDMVPAATAKARDEAARMQKIVDAEKGGFKLGAADWVVLRRKGAEGRVRPRRGAGPAVLRARPRARRRRLLRRRTKLYGVTFKERKDIPVYQADVRVWEVVDADGKPLALYYGDFFSRPNKSGGAWCDSFVDQSRLLGTKPAVVNVTNFTKPAAGQPAFLTFDDVTTLFHEFGHALHAMFQNVGYPALGSTPNDFVEFPSQFNEHWALEPSVLAQLRPPHSDRPAPAAGDLSRRSSASRTFNQGYATTEYLAAALLDMAWHTLPADAPLQDVDAFEPAALQRFQVDLPAGAAALPHDVLLAHLGRRLRGRLLRLPLE